MSNQETASSLIGHGPCPDEFDCGSSDACGRYTDGHGFCFSCDKYWTSNQMEGRMDNTETTPPKDKHKGGLLSVTYTPLGKRRINEETCRFWKYGVTEDGRQVANYLDDQGNVVAQKVRTRDKKFTILGNPKAMRLYGQWLWAKGGRNLVITEGELDALSMSQVQDLKWPVVSVPNGAGGAKKAVAAQLEFVESFDRVVIMFDGDEAGQEAAAEVAQLLSPGKGCIARLPNGCKDASDALQKGNTAALVTAFWNASPYRPDGILSVTDIVEKMMAGEALQPLAMPFTKELFAKTRHIVRGQLWMVCGGSGMGKTEFARQFSYDLIGQGLRVGHVGLEESVDRSLTGFVGLHIRERLDIWEDLRPDGTYSAPYEHPRWEEGRAYFEDKLYCYDDWGSVGEKNLLSKVRFMRVGLQCDVIVLDHLSILVSDLESEEDERRTIDRVMTKLRSLSEETGAVIICISHLKRPQGIPHEEGGRTSLSQLRGSASIGQLSDICIGLERNQQATDGTQNITLVRILKNRRTGRVGPAGYVSYNDETGWMESVPEPTGFPADSNAGKQATGDPQQDY